MSVKITMTVSRERALKILTEAIPGLSDRGLGSLLSELANLDESKAAHHLNNFIVKPDHAKWPESLICVCSWHMYCIRHEAQPIADQVMRIYKCPNCGETQRKAFSIYDEGAEKFL